MITLARENGLLLAPAATHPFADWRVQEIYPDERYQKVVEDMQLVARANLIFGLHVHVGIEDRETAIHMMNHARYFLPHILALSTNSPFWLGMKTGLKSYRCKVFDKFPRTNIPDYFPSWGEYENFVKLLIKTNCIDNAKKIWWDIRPHPFFNTLEFRDLRHPDAGGRDHRDGRADPGDGGEALQAARSEPGLPALPPRADHGEQVAGGALRDRRKDDRLRQADEVPVRELILEYLEFVDDVVDELGSREEIEYMHKILEMGTGADRQLRVFEETGDLKKVVDYIIEETEVGVAEDADPVSERKAG